uniref:Serine-threonine protein kinase n=1 Tax=Rhinella marina erythrocytic-like virus TaxID=2859906 RepID=A0A8F6YI19_9VIRU|nr:serine-threonine protein kinase [Rhinella marina erythrocytic-like virus]
MTYTFHLSGIHSPLHLRDITGKMWILGKCLGNGGFAHVYETNTDENVVLKIFKNKNSYTAELFTYQSLFSETLVEQYKIDHALGHLGFPKLYAHGHSRDYNPKNIKSKRYYFIAIHKLYPVKQLIQEEYRDNNLVMMITQLLDVLEFMHSHKWTHNDLKYDNIMVDHHRNFYLLDFGLVTTFVDAEETPVDMPTIGTVKYMSLDAHRGFVNPPRGDLVNLVFVLKLLLESPWDIDKHVFYSGQTATLLEKEEFIKNPKCGNFTKFCKAVLNLEYKDSPNYNHLKSLLPTQPKVQLIKSVYIKHCGFILLDWVFSVIFQTHILPYMFRMNKKLYTVKDLKPGLIDVEDVMFILDAKKTDNLITNGLELIGENKLLYTNDANNYVSLCLESWIAHVGKSIKNIRLKHKMSINQAIYELTKVLSMARP